MATWAKGIDFKNSGNTTRIGGVGVYGSDTTPSKIYLGLGTEPWSQTGLEITSSNITFKGNKIYHAGSKPTPAEIGAAASSHTHSYLPLSGGTITSTVFGPLIIKRSGSTNAASIQFVNDNGTLGSIGMSGGANTGLIRWNTDTNVSYTILDTGNYKTYVTPANIGAAASSHSHSYLPLNGGSLTGKINNSYTTGTYLAGNQGNTLVNSTAAAGSYTMLFRYPSTNGYFTTGGYQGSYLLQYTAKTTVDAGTNSVTKSVTLLNESGNTSFPGTVTAASFSGAVSGNASTATTLQTARTLTIGSTGKSFNGSANVSWSLAEIGAAASSHTHNYAGSSSAGGAATSALACTGNSATATKLQTARTLFGKSFDGSGNVAGKALVYGTYTSTASSRYTNGALEIRENGLVGSAQTDIGYAPQLGFHWSGKIAATLAMSSGGEFQFINQAGTGYSNVRAGTFYGALSGNASTASSAATLTTARTINGTSFNGSANITTANWGTARTLTIGSTGKSVNGSANVSWSLSEIGAAAASHNHGLLHDSLAVTLANTTTDSGWSMINGSYNGFLLKSIRTQASTPGWIVNNYGAGVAFGGSDTKGVLSVAYSSPLVKFAGGNSTKPVWWIGITGNSGSTYNLASLAANTANTLATARTINGTSFNGSANITTANWGTARTITIGSTGKSVNGSGNVSWSLSEIGAAAASHSHSYLPLSGGTLNGKLTVNSTVAIGTDPNGKACLGYETSSTDTYICNSAGNWLRLKTDKTMTYAGYKVFTAYEKPTASDVGALAITGSTSSGNIWLRNTSAVVGVQFYRGSSTGNYTRLAQADESGNLRIENYSGGSVVGDYVFANGNFSPRRGNPYLGYSSYRWGQIYSTIGSISTSDSKLKENIKVINRSEINTLNNEPTSYDFYNYIKNTGVYTFNYKKEVSNDTQTWLGILADEIPDNIFDKIGMMSKTEEEYQDELLKQEEAKKILESTPCPLNDDESNDNIIEGTSYTYNELKYEAEKYIEEPIRMLNSSSQIAMLQEVLSIALNKIDTLENELNETKEYIKNKL